MDKISYYQNQLEKELDNYPIFQLVESKTGINKALLVFSALGIFLVLIMFNFAGSLLTNIVAWIYPAYASFKAIESPTRDDDKQWLTYWTVVSFFSMVEFFSDILLFWFPFYYLIKTSFLVYLMLPHFRGAENIYQLYLRPFLLHHTPKIDAYVTKTQASVNSSKRQK